MRNEDHTRGKRERRARPVIFRARRVAVSREGSDSIHLHLFLDGKKRMTFAIPRGLALEISGNLEAATF